MGRRKHEVEFAVGDEKEFFFGIAESLQVLLQVEVNAQVAVCVAG